MGAKIRLGKDSAALMLVAQIRDEDAPGAITGGAARGPRCAWAAGSWKKCGLAPKARASAAALWWCARRGCAGVEDIATVEGISRELAEEIYRACARVDSAVVQAVAPPQMGGLAVKLGCAPPVDWPALRL